MSPRVRPLMSSVVDIQAIIDKGVQGAGQARFDSICGFYWVKKLGSVVYSNSRINFN